MNFQLTSDIVPIEAKRYATSMATSVFYGDQGYADRRTPALLNASHFGGGILENSAKGEPRRKAPKYATACSIN